MQNIIGLSGFLTPLFKPPQIYRLIMQILLRYNKSFRLSIKVWRLAFVVLSQLILNMAMSYLSLILPGNLDGNTACLLKPLF